MTIAKEQAAKLIKHIGDEKVMLVIAFVQDMQNETAASGSLSNDDKKRREAFDGLGDRIAAVPGNRTARPERS
ncbi:hypothetical protein ACYULU_04895 [Breznakiellaceae bacterium SP9]